MSDPFDSGLFDEDGPFEIDDQVSHLFKHPSWGVDDSGDVWASDPLFLSRQATGPLADGRRRIPASLGRSAGSLEIP